MSKINTTTPNRFSSARQSVLVEAHRSALRIHIVDAPEVRAILKMFPVRQRKDVSIYASSYNNGVTFSLSLRDLDSMKANTLTRVLESFADGWQAETRDYTYEVPNRDFVFTKRMPVTLKENNAHVRWLTTHGYRNAGDPLMAEITVYVSAYVKADSDSCRIEVVERKEEVVMTEVKRIVCA